ncbi:MAG: PAS domain-containing protein, partial [Lentisphaeria bacterium]|nr:PAS domain-containing protein [Lentisphaeria bacterium]
MERNSKDLLADVMLPGMPLSPEITYLLESLPTGILIWSVKREVLYVNELWEQYFEFSSDDVVGLNEKELNKLILSIVAEPDYVRVVLTDFRSKPEKKQHGSCHILPIDSRTDAYLEFSIELVEQGQLKGCILEHYQNIDNRMRLMQENHDFQKRLIQSQKMEVVGILAAGAFHDMNNILSIVSGYTQMLHVNPSAGDKYLSKIDSSCQLMIQIIQQVMNFATARQTQFELREVEDIIDNSIELLGHCIPKRIILHWEKPAPLTAMYVDPTQIFQLILNLCLNAAQAIPDKGGIDINLVETEIMGTEQELQLEKGSYLQLDVCDTGCGMGEQTSANLFKPFFTKKLKENGKGLGLFVVNQIIENHDAAVYVSSEKG